MSTTDGKSLELLVALLRQAAEEKPEETPDPRRRTGGWIALAAFSVALLVPIVLVAVAIAPKLPASGRAAPSPAGATFAGRPAHTAAAVPSAVPLPMPPDAIALTRAELGTLVARLPSHISLTAPAGWARHSGVLATDATPGAGCPQVFGWIGNRLGGAWTYASGALPQGFCIWAPEPFTPQQPTPDRFVVEIGFERGTVGALLNRPALCVGGAVAPRLGVPSVANGAVLAGCDDGLWPTFELRVPDAGGSGVWFLRSASGANQHTFAASDGLLAALDAATHAYN